MRKLLPGKDEFDEETYILELEEQIMQLEDPILSLLERLPWEDRAVLDSYIHAMRELQLYGALHAYKRGKRSGDS